MTKEGFLHSIEEIVHAPLFIGEDRQEEIANNMWRISVCSELANALTVEDLSAFFDRVISNRKEQVRLLKPIADMLFYLWFDEQASQIRFNVISDAETGLPFVCKIALTNNYNVILKNFLEHPFHDGIPLENMQDIDFNGEYDSESYSLNVYCVTL